MLLTPAERILLLNILAPTEGNALLLRGARKLRKDLSFSDQEILDWKVVMPPMGSTGPCLWEGNERVEIEISPIVRGYVGSCLGATESAGKLHEGLLDLYDQFFPEA